MLDAPALAGFVAIVDTGSMHVAARQMNISQAALSRRLQRLEASLGVRLFVRAGRRLHLSPAGSRLLPAARTHLDGLVSACASLRAEAHYGRPTVTLGCLPTISTSVLPGVLAAYLRKRPEVRVRLLDLSASEIEHHVRAGTADFGINALGLDSPGLSGEVIGEDPMMLVVSRAHAFASLDAVPWSALKGEPLIASGLSSGNRRLLDSVRSHIAVDLNWQHEVQHMATAIAWASAGIAHAVLPLLALAHEPPDDVCALPLVQPAISRRIGIIRRAGEPLPPPADALRRAIAGDLRQALAGQSRPGGE